jgi:hypothetical protein
MPNPKKHVCALKTERNELWSLEEKHTKAGAKWATGGRGAGAPQGECHTEAPFGKARFAPFSARPERSEHGGKGEAPSNYYGGECGSLFSLPSR